jgi:hypothetical protein
MGCFSLWKITTGLKSLALKVKFLISFRYIVLFGSGTFALFLTTGNRL